MPILPTSFLTPREQEVPNPNETISLTQHNTILANLTTTYNTIGFGIFVSCWVFTCLMLALLLLQKLYFQHRPDSLVRHETAALEVAVRRFMRLGEGRRQGGVRRVLQGLEGRTGRDVGEQVVWIVGRVVQEERGRQMERRMGGRELGMRRARCSRRWWRRER